MSYLTQEKNNDNNDLDEATCLYAGQSSDYIKQDINKNYKKFQKEVNELAEPLSNVFGLTEQQRKHFNFKNAALYSDTLVARQFESLPLDLKGNQTFTKEQLKIMLKMNKYSQLSKYTPEAKKMWASQMMFKPVQIIDSLVQNKKDAHQQPKYLMYSSHDTQVGILWEWLNFTSF